MLRFHGVAPLALGALLAVTLPACAPKSGGKGARTIVIWEQMDPRGARALRGQPRGLPADAIPASRSSTRPTRPSTCARSSRPRPPAAAAPTWCSGRRTRSGPLSLLKTIQPLDQVLPAGFFDRFIPSLARHARRPHLAAPDQVGNHLVLCFNRKLVPKAPHDRRGVRRRWRSSSRRDGVYGFAMNLTEPYWLVPFLGGFGGWVMDAQAQPDARHAGHGAGADLPQGPARPARLMPQECDYQIAETLFKEGKAAMIVNGPWSWSGYRKAGIDLGIAPLLPHAGRALGRSR